MEQSVKLRESSLHEDSLLAKHFYQMWRDNAVPADAVKFDWLKITLQFIKCARQELHYKAFVAEVDGKVIGSVSSQLFAGLYPNVLTEKYRKYGYIWGVYVEQTHRKQGLGKKLTGMAIAHLKSLGCTRAVLHASPSGKLVYSSLGFSESNGMFLDLI